jgi:hypothetical protein
MSGTPSTILCFVSFNIHYGKTLQQANIKLNVSFNVPLADINTLMYIMSFQKITKLSSVCHSRLSNMGNMSIWATPYKAKDFLSAKFCQSFHIGNIEDNRFSYLVSAYEVFHTGRSILFKLHIFPW